MLTDMEGKAAVHLARKTIELFLEKGQITNQSDVDLPPIFNELRGVFVTLTKHDILRGCIGHPYPDSPLVSAIIDSAISAATRDPRFPPVQSFEIKNISVEVTVLTQPELIDVPPQKLPEMIEIGRHGLIVKKGYYQGLLLPQVAPENDFDQIDFLNHTCLKAGLNPDAWLSGAEVYWFEGQIFKETSPRGDVVEKKFKDMC
ncbi:MAG: TIGR00296 family protein [Methanosarcinaceae archaeon]|nr:TIGR00296 family protein [Methanosarcinaceae archaeon]